MRTILVAALAAMMFAQTPEFRVTTRLIQVSVIVTDHRGEPVTGLQKGDFSLLDRRKQQKIVSFTEQTGLSQAEPAIKVRPAETVFSNRPQNAQNATVILFDRLNTRFEQAAFARAKVVKFLHSLRPTDRIALYGLSGQLVVLHDFTEDASALLGALDAYKPAETNETRATTFKESNSGHGLIDWFENKSNQAESDVYMGARVKETAAALQAIANHLAGVPGRKNLVWVSAAFPFTIGYFQKRLAGTQPAKDSFDREVETAARALSNADVAIYPVDAHALTGLGGVFDPSQAPKSGVLKMQTSVPLPEVMPTEELNTMNTLADATGGRVFDNSNDLSRAVRRAIDDTAFTYTLGYYPDHQRWDGAFREIKVKVNHPGVDLRYRRGYIATPDSSPNTSRSTADVIRRPLESGELGLSVTPERVESNYVKMHIHVDTSAVRFEEKNGEWEGSLDIQWAQISEEGLTVAGYGQNIRIHLTPQAYETAAHEGLKLSSVEKIDDHAAQIRLAARDPLTGVSGSIFIPIQSLPK